MTPDVLAIEHITVETRRGGERLILVDDVSLSLKRAEILALVGPSGSGKSLTCAASLDVLPPGTRKTSGTLMINGSEQDPVSSRGRQVATVLQHPRGGFNPVRTMRDHAWESLKALGVPADEREPRILRAMSDAGLKDPHEVLPLHPFEMSGGMLQRMMIALALASGAPFLFADEPTTDLDLVVQREILNLFVALRRQHSLGILLVTHDMGVVASVADRVAVMDAARVVEMGPVADVFHRPRHPVTRRLVQAHLSLYPQEGAA